MVTKFWIKKHILPWVPTLRIPSVTRISLESELRRYFARLDGGVVLDVGAKHSPYRQWLSYEKYYRLDVDPDTRPDVCCDVTEIKWESNYFNVVIATEVLEHLPNPQVAVDELWRVLKPGGICLASTRFICHYHRSLKSGHPSPGDFYRFSWDSLGYLFRHFRIVEICHHGNGVQAIWQILTSGKGAIFLNIFNPLIARIKVKNTKCPLGFIVYAQK